MSFLSPNSKQRSLARPTNLQKVDLPLLHWAAYTGGVLGAQEALASSGVLLI